MNRARTDAVVPNADLGEPAPYVVRDEQPWIRERRHPDAAAWAMCIGVVGLVVFVFAWIGLGA